MYVIYLSLFYYEGHEILQAWIQKFLTGGAQTFPPSMITPFFVRLGNFEYKCIKRQGTPGHQ